MCSYFEINHTRQFDKCKSEEGHINTYFFYFTDVFPLKFTLLHVVAISILTTIFTVITMGCNTTTNTIIKNSAVKGKNI